MTTTQPEMHLELVPVPVSDVDRAKAWYVEVAGFRLDFDLNPSEGMRVIQLTPPGSHCSIVVGTGMEGISDMVPGSLKGLHLVVTNIEEARNALLERGAEIGDITDFGGVKYAWFNDPDGNLWGLQEVPPRS